jgi:hypothetical protein
MVAVRKSMTSVAGARRILAYLLMLSATLITGWLLRRTGISWMAAAAIQMTAGFSLALLFRFTEPLKSLKLITDRTESA